VFILSSLLLYALLCFSTTGFQTMTTTSDKSVLTNMVSTFKTRQPFVYRSAMTDDNHDLIFKSRKPDWGPIWRMKNFDEDTFNTIKTMMLERLVVADHKDTPLSVGTPWSIPQKQFIKMFKKEFATASKNSMSDIYDAFDFQALVEGTEINVYYYKGLWRFATKYKDGDTIKNGEADCETVALFESTAKAVGLDIDAALDKKLSYNFVFQHPAVVYVHKFVSHAIYLDSVFMFNKREKNAIQLLDFKLPKGVKSPQSMPVNSYLGLKGTFDEWKGTLSKHAWMNDPYECKFLMHNSTIRGITITHVATGLRTNITNYHFKGLYRTSNGCICDVHEKCSCSMKGAMPRSMSGNIADATLCEEVCYYCKSYSYICRECAELCNMKVKMEASYVYHETDYCHDDDFDTGMPDDDDYDDHGRDDVEYASSCRCMTCRNDALNRL
jgi:hypothetical protein